MTERETKAIEELKNNSTDLCEELIEEGSILEEFAIVCLVYLGVLQLFVPVKVKEALLLMKMGNLILWTTKP